ncbi:GTPase HflX [Ignisphaera sp. 4213-co]|uniref:GTPase HflX n=1 Tax=Ignisphaera cupida TaxID=3050454 RepID=A0ABD4Z482_9CREN|nr:GTPase HflX [Ignisphaera sp. 4213-co]MDK6027767.1 GTPase HflX [Ignisphaera sp. 4213-co]
MIIKENTILVIKKEDMQYIDEIVAVVKEAGFEPKLVVKISKIDTSCYLTYGKILKLKYEMESNNVKKLCIYDNLKPRQITCLMKELNAEIIDHVMLLLKIFQMHAGSKEALLQIEMARLLHELPLIREWIRRSKMGELPGFLGGGRYAIDVQYEHVRRRIARIRKELSEIRARRQIERERRRSSGWIHVAIIGYTNAGKTSLFNALTNLNKPTGNEMFTTLTPKSYAINICSEDAEKIVLVDTIGFIKKLPIEIIEAFKVVLEEIRHADILLLVIDVSKDFASIHNEIDSSLNILSNIGFEGKPMIIALNKIDLLNSQHKKEGNIDEIIEAIHKYLLSRNVNVIGIIPISALKGLNIDTLKEFICRAVSQLKILKNMYMY